MGTAPKLIKGHRPAAGAAARTTGSSFGVIRNRRGGFTLVEIMIVVVIIGLLAAIAIPTFSRVKIKSQAARMANDFRQYEAAFQRFSLENGSLPGSAAASAIPAGMTGYLSESYTQNSPLGGTYEWDGAPNQNILLTGTYATDEVMLLVDKTLDDGDLTTGAFTKPAASTFSYHIP